MSAPQTPRLESALRAAMPQALGVLLRRTGDFDRAEDALQEALVAATDSWRREGVPSNPTGWLVTVARRRLVEMWRQDAARRAREQTVTDREGPERAGSVGWGTEPPDALDCAHRDDSLLLLFGCCHPSLTRPSQVALTLRAVGGLTTAEIARAFLVPESHDGATDQPGQTADRASRCAFRTAPAGRTRGPRPGRARDDLPRIHRGTRAERRRHGGSR